MRRGLKVDSVDLGAADAASDDRWVLEESRKYSTTSTSTAAAEVTYGSVSGTAAREGVMGVLQGFGS